MTPTDQRALSLIAWAGKAQAVAWRGYWIAGGHRVHQQTIRRLVEVGMVEHDGATTVVPTEAGARSAGPSEPYRARDVVELEVSEWHEVHAVEDDEAWSPPDHRRANDEPVPVDEAIRDE